MQESVLRLLKSIEDPVLMFGHFTYALLIISMLMRNIVWLRVLAVGSGVAKIVYRQFFVYDPVSVLWEAVFVLVNLSQLFIMAWENRRRRMRPEEQTFIDMFKPQLPHAAAAALLGAGVWKDIEDGASLTREGEPVDALIYIAFGAVRIEAGGRVVAACGAGDFLGEMTWRTSAPATGTAVADGPVRCLYLGRAPLEAALRKRPVLGFAIESGINRNLIDKLVRSNKAKAAAA